MSPGTSSGLRRQYPGGSLRPRPACNHRRSPHGDRGRHLRNSFRLDLSLRGIGSGDPCLSPGDHFTKRCPSGLGETRRHHGILASLRQILLPHPRVSPDGRKVLLSQQDESRSLWLFDLDRGVIGPVTGNEGNQFWAIWTPDGKNIVFNSQQGSEPVNLWMKPADGSAPPTRLTTAPIHHLPMDMTRDGRTVIFISNSGIDGTFDVHALHLDDPPTIEPLLDSDEDECQPTLSPDERWIAYSSGVAGALEIYVQAFPNPGNTVRVSRMGAWIRSGHLPETAFSIGRRTAARFSR